MKCFSPAKPALEFSISSSPHGACAHFALGNCHRFTRESRGGCQGQNVDGGPSSQLWEASARPASPTAAGVAASQPLRTAPALPPRRPLPTLLVPVGWAPASPKLGADSTHTHTHTQTHSHSSASHAYSHCCTLTHTHRFTLTHIHSQHLTYSHTYTLTHRHSHHLTQHKHSHSQKWTQAHTHHEHAVTPPHTHTHRRSLSHRRGHQGPPARPGRACPRPPCPHSLTRVEGAVTGRRLRSSLTSSRQHSWGRNGVAGPFVSCFRLRRAGSQVGVGFSKYTLCLGNFKAFWRV